MWKSKEEDSILDMNSIKNVTETINDLFLARNNGRKTVEHEKRHAGHHGTRPSAY